MKAVLVAECSDSYQGSPLLCLGNPTSPVESYSLDDFLAQHQHGGFSIPEISAQEAVMLCSAVTLLLGTAWVFKQLARAIRTFQP